jgi:hypothetical protein
MPSPTSILQRLIQPSEGSFSIELAKYILSVNFTDEEQEACEALSYKAQDGTLTEEERQELESYLSTNSLLILLKSKARQSLARQTSAA